jgi:hypothetical protein
MQPVYYKVFKPEGLVPCRRPMDWRDPYLALIEAGKIPPPHTVATITQHICMAEKIADTQRVLEFKLFESASSVDPLDKQKHLTIVDGSGPGVDPEEPLTLVICNLLEKPILARQKRGEQQTICALVS